MRNKTLTRWRINFFTGLAVILPVVISVALLVWLYYAISGLTNMLLFFLPREWTRDLEGAGEIHWYWSLLALVVTVILITLVGRFARFYVGRKVIQFADIVMSKIPLFNKVYGTVKQVNDAISSNKKSSFRQVVLIEFPRHGLYSIGFVTGEQGQEFRVDDNQKLVSVFVPTTPNPTSGYLVLVPESDVIKLRLSVAEGIKCIISLGSVAPTFTSLDSAEKILINSKTE